MKVVVSYKATIREDDSRNLSLKYVFIVNGGKVYDVRLSDELPYRLRKLVEELIVTTLTMGRIISRYVEEPRQYECPVIHETDEIDLLELFSQYFHIVNEMDCENERE